jgi:hypothetical protein
LRVRKGAAGVVDGADEGHQELDEEESGEGIDTNGMSEAEQFAL